MEHLGRRRSTARNTRENYFSCSGVRILRAVGCGARAELEDMMNRSVVHTGKVPPARVPLSQAIKVGDWVFTSGQLGMDPRTGRLIEGGIKAETRQVCENLKAVLEAGGSSLEKAVKVTIYLADLGELLPMNEVFGEYFPKDPPARTTFQAAGLVAGARVEIEAVAFV
jgi:2-iminobutanoate/2-iminopropanoate deaminase